MENQLLEAWFVNNRINLFLIDKISDEGMNCTLSKRGGRSVELQFVHMHNVRCKWLEVIAKDLLRNVKPFDKVKPIDKKLLKQSFEQSADAIGELIKKGLNNEGKVKGFKRRVFTLMSYFIAHDSHHRGSILLTLKQCGHKVDQQVQYGIWEWDKI